jgi:cyclopropane-fatty-acyl-phospholipid synthase
MFWEARLQKFVEHMRRSNLPLRIQLWDGNCFDLGAAPAVTLVVKKTAALRHLLSPTLDGLGHAYVEGEIEVTGKVMDIVDTAAHLAAHAIGKTRHGARMVRHTRKIDAEAIAYHYDVSNDFYALWLDRNMVYSCGYFRTPQDSLEDAQMQKIDHILTKIRLRPGDRLLDVGCGWGALAMRAAQKFGARVLGVTLSQRQYELACERIAAAGLQDRCEIRIEDYRDVTGSFDRITSVGMFEHVGLKNLRGYFARLRTLLADDGIMMNHGITSTDAESAESPFGGGDFIDRYVFPHGELPHIGLVLEEMSAAGLEAVDVENLRRHYALTLRHWAERFESAPEQLRELAGEKRWRIWRMYLAGCAYGFEQDWISIHQVLAVKSGVASPLPLTRDYMYGG